MKEGRHDRFEVASARPSLESLRKQAKKLARDIAAGDAAAIARARAHICRMPTCPRRSEMRSS